MHNEIIITKSLTLRQKKEVAEIYFKSFIKKFSALILFTKDSRKAEKILLESINYDSGLYAIKDKEVVGFIGLETNGLSFLNIKLASLKKNFNLIGGLFRYIGYSIYRLFHSRVWNDKVHIDPIAVSENARGLGIGSKLLEDSFALAKSLKKKEMTLEVVDTNPEAKKLYERKGFITTRIENLGFVIWIVSIITEFAGFKKVIHMKKALE